MPAGPLYSPGGEAKPGGGSWYCQLPTDSTCQVAACQVAGGQVAGGQQTNMLVSHVAPHPAAAVQLASWMVKVEVADRGHLAFGRGGEPAGGGAGEAVVGGGEAAGGDRPGKTHSHRLWLL